MDRKRHTPDRNPDLRLTDAPEAPAEAPSGHSTDLTPEHLAQWAKMTKRWGWAVIAGCVAIAGVLAGILEWRVRENVAPVKAEMRELRDEGRGTRQAVDRLADRVDRLWDAPRARTVDGDKVAAHKPN